MKSYTIPALTLLAASGVLAFVIAKSFGSASQAASDLAREQDAVTADTATLHATEIAAKTAARRSVETDAFLDKWNAELDNEANIEDVLASLDTLAVNSLLSPAGKNFRLNAAYPFEGKHLSVQTVNMTVSGEYYRTLNWLGAAEHAYPLARVEQISYTNTGSALSMAVQLSFPRKFELQ